MKNLIILTSVLFLALGVHASHSKRKLKRTYKCSQVGVQKIKAHKGAALKDASSVRPDSIAKITPRNKNHERFLAKQKRDSLKLANEKTELVENNEELLYPKPVYFRFDSYQLDIVDLTQVVLATEWVKKGYAVTLVGHTDNQGAERYNHLLSISRAMHIKDLMIEMGCDANLIEVQGEGESKPQSDNETIDGRLNNRRVEFLIATK
jgi:outer membrane protein OmpA-like peptidoglycan-associated protein